MLIPIVAQLALWAVILVFWEMATHLLWVQAAILPAPEIVLNVAYGLMHDRNVINQLGVTFMRILVAFAIAVPIAFVLGILIVERPRFGRSFEPFVRFGMAIPQSVFLPIFLLLFGIGFTQKVMFGLTHILFVVTIVTIAAIRSVPEGLAMAGRSFGAKRYQIWSKIYFPAMLPMLIGGMRIGLVFDVGGVLLAEMYSSRDGVGQLIYRWGDELQIAKLFALLLIISLATISINEVLRLVELKLRIRHPQREGGKRWTRRVLQST